MVGLGDTVKPQIYIPHFALLRFYALFVQSLPNAHKNNGIFSLDLMFPNLVCPEFTLNFRSHDYAIYPILHFTVFFSEFLFMSGKAQLATSQ